MSFFLRRGVMSSAANDPLLFDSNITAFNAQLTHVYKMEETSGTLKDSVGSLDSTSTISGDYSSTTGKRNNGINHNGSTSGLVFPDSNPFVDTSQNFAFSCWFKHDGVAGAGNIFSQYAITADRLSVRGLINPSTTLCNFYMTNTSSSSYGISTTAAISDTSKYHHFLATKIGTAMQLWINGGSIGTATFSGTEVAGIKSRLFSRNQIGESEILKADLDELYFWEGLTFGGANPSEADFVASLYNSGSGRFYA